MNMYTIAIIAGMTLAGCGNPEGKKTTEGQTAAADTAAKPAIAFTNGVTEANRGSKSGKVQVKATLDSPGVTKKLYIWETQGKTLIVKDSTASTTGTFDFGTDTYESGVYAIGPVEQNSAQFIISVAEPVVELGFRSQKLDAGVYAINSKENEGWAKYVPQEKTILEAIKQNRISMAKTSMKAQFEAEIAKKEAELAGVQATLINQYPGTFLAKLLTWKQEPEKNNKSKYWDNVDFSDASLVRTMILPDRIQNFMRTHSGGEENGFLNCVDAVAQKAMANADVLEFALYQMLSGFYESNMENIAVYIADNYIHGEACGDHEVSNLLKSNTDAIMSLRVGKNPPNIVMSTSEGKGFDLYKTCKANKYTLVMFWASWCEHCKGEAPEVKMYYDQWRSRGVEFLGVSVDNNPILWQNALKERGFTFPQVCGMKMWDSKVAKDYKVTKTPTFFLLDSEGKIVLKPKGIRETNQWLAQNLK